MATVFLDQHGVLPVDLMPQEHRSIQEPTALLYGSFEEHSKTNGAAGCQKMFCSSTITHGLILLERLGS
ncbi:hypothetical protein TNCV_3269811 [Trichonephila clavipes]|uniref:Uncharacterized protein n=1 Tax=Trichonephila clavipes TaxID=2585209 RepID=A0A8X6VF43_TRICX|nr:hypothetical protein TNCV_3269811 [Trichonephila clavipes]